MLAQVVAHDADAALVERENIDSHGGHSQVNEVHPVAVKLIHSRLDAVGPVQNGQLDAGLLAQQSGQRTHPRHGVGGGFERMRVGREPEDFHTI